MRYSQEPRKKTVNCPQTYPFGTYAHLWSPDIDNAVSTLAHEIVEDIEEIVGAQVPRRIEGLLGRWSWPTQTIHRFACILVMP